MFRDKPLDRLSIVTNMGPPRHSPIPSASPQTVIVVLNLSYADACRLWALYERSKDVEDLIGNSPVEIQEQSIGVALVNKPAPWHPEWPEWLTFVERLQEEPVLLTTKDLLPRVVQAEEYPSLVAARNMGVFVGVKMPGGESRTVLHLRPQDLLRALCLLSPSAKLDQWMGRYAQNDPLTVAFAIRFGGLPLHNGAKEGRAIPRVSRQTIAPLLSDSRPIVREIGIAALSKTSDEPCELQPETSGRPTPTREMK